MIKYLLTIISVLFITGAVLGQTMMDTLFTYKAETPVVIDGQATEDCWANAEWHAIDQVWIPWGTTMKPGDFAGKFKTAWDENYLYLLVQIVDDSLSDDHSNILDSYWEDDCVEVFIDEDRSGGDQERNNNAFSYHTSLFGNAVDVGNFGQGVDYSQNLEVDMDTIAQDTYLWEFAIKMYDATFNINDPDDSRVYLSNNKLMGFAIAYCDNDETNGRENFIGSMVMTQAHYNDMYKNASYFGPMLLIDQNDVTAVKATPTSEIIDIYPVPANDVLHVRFNSGLKSEKEVSVYSITGELMQTKTFFENSYTMKIGNLQSGIYIVKVENGTQVFEKKIAKQ